MRPFNRYLQLQQVSPTCVALPFKCSGYKASSCPSLTRLQVVTPCFQLVYYKCVNLVLYRTKSLVLKMYLGSSFQHSSTSLSLVYFFVLVRMLNLETLINLDFLDLCMTRTTQLGLLCGQKSFLFIKRHIEVTSWVLRLKHQELSVFPLLSLKKGVPPCQHAPPTTSPTHTTLLLDEEWRL